MKAAEIVSFCSWREKIPCAAQQLPQERVLLQHLRVESMHEALPPNIALSVATSNENEEQKEIEQSKDALADQEEAEEDNVDEDNNDSLGN